MRSLSLGHRLPSGMSWTEESPPGGIQHSTMTFGGDFGSRVLNIKINWLGLAEAIKHIVGYSLTWPIFDPTNLSAQGPYTLRRVLPARHPEWPNLFATKILSVQGRGQSKATGFTKTSGKVKAGSGYYGNWEFAYISILFEVPKFTMLTDEQLSKVGVLGSGSPYVIVPGGAAVNTPVPEYLRHTLWEFDANIETLARKGEQWTMMLAAAYAQQPRFAMDRLLRQAKGTLRVTTFDIHEDFVKLGRLVPSNYFNRLSTVNSLAFPQYSFRDQNQAGDVPTQFRPGTCLLMPPKITPHSQMHPAVLTGEIDASFFPRTVDVQATMIVFNPPVTDVNASTIDLSAARYGPGSLQQKIYGHNLVPLEKPLPNGGRWFAAQNNAGGRITRATAANPVVITSVNHGLANGQTVTISTLSFTAGSIIGADYVITVLTANTFSLNGLNAVGLGTFRGEGTWIANGVAISDVNLLHQYSNFEQLWRAPETLA